MFAVVVVIVVVVIFVVTLVVVVIVVVAFVVVVFVVMSFCLSLSSQRGQIPPPIRGSSGRTGPLRGVNFGARG